MSLSLRLPLPLESEILAYSGRTGLSKSAVIVRSIQEFLRAHAQPSAFELYEEAMRGVSETDAIAAAPDSRAHKQAIAQAVRRKHAERSARASDAAASAVGGAARRRKKTA